MARWRRPVGSLPVLRVRADQGLHRRRGVRRAVDLARREQPAEAVLEFRGVGVGVRAAHCFFSVFFFMNLRRTRAQHLAGLHC